MNKIFKLFLFLFGLIFIFSSAISETLEGSYIGGFIGYAYVSHKTYHNITDNMSASLALMGGYSFNQYVATDIGATIVPTGIYIKHDDYYWQSKTNISRQQSTTSVITDVAVRLSVPMSPFASAYIHLGPGATFGNPLIGSGNNLGIFTGVGAKFKVAQPLGIVVEDYGILMPNAKAQDINIISLGLVYEF